MLVDSGAFMMSINETILPPLELSFVEKEGSDGQVFTCLAFVLPGDNEPLSGVIPTEEMGV